MTDTLKRIAIIIPATDLYGAPQFGLSLGDSISNNPNTEVHLIFPADRGTLNKTSFTFPKNNVFIHYTPMPVLRRYQMMSINFPFYAMKFILQFFHFLYFISSLKKMYSYHVVSATNMSGLAVRMIFPNALIIWSLHERLNWFEKATLGNIMGVASNVTACSFYCLNQLPTYARNKADVIYSGISYLDFPLNFQRDFSNVVRILMIGRINSWKGQDILIDALKMIPDEIDYVCRIVGSPIFGQIDFYEDLVKKVNSSPLKNRVDFVGETRNKWDQFGWADVVVVPSKFPEPFGRVTVEALAAGCAVISTKPGGAVEILKDGEFGTVVPCGDVAELAGAIVDILTNKEKLAQFRSNGPLRAMSFEDRRTMSDLVDAHLSASTVKKIRSYDI